MSTGPFFVQNRDQRMTIIKTGSARTDTGGVGDTLGPFQTELISDNDSLTQFGAFIETLSPGSS